MTQMWFFYCTLSLFVRWNKWLDVCKLKRISFGMHTLDMLLTRGKSKSLETQCARKSVVKMENAVICINCLLNYCNIDCMICLLHACTAVMI